MRRVTRLALGGFHSAALSDLGDVYVWGDGRNGAPRTLRVGMPRTLCGHAPHAVRICPARCE
eukprot:7375664-Prymnesium_polylepis.1